MSKVLFQITEEDVRKEIRTSESLQQLLPEAVQEILDAISEMDVEEVIVDLLLQYGIVEINKQIQKCMNCADVQDCSEGKHIILSGMEALNQVRKPVTLSGVN